MSQETLHRLEPIALPCGHPSRSPQRAAGDVVSVCESRRSRSIPTRATTPLLCPTNTAPPVDLALPTPGAHHALLTFERTLLIFHPHTESTQGGPTGRAGAKQSENETRCVQGQQMAGTQQSLSPSDKSARLCPSREPGQHHPCKTPLTSEPFASSESHGYPQIGRRLTESSPTQGYSLSICRRERAQMDSSPGTAHAELGSTTLRDSIVPPWSPSAILSCVGVWLWGSDLCTVTPDPV